MKLRNIPHLVGQGFVSFWRNGVMTTASILVLICCMLVLGSFYAVVANLSQFIQNEVDELKIINAYVDADVSQERIQEIKEELQALCDKENSNIISYEHITKDEVLAQMIEKSDAMAEVLAKYDSTNNPMPETFYIRFESFDDVQSLLRDLETIFGDNLKSRVDTYESLKDLRTTAALVGFWLMSILLIVAVLVIMNTVKLTVYARRKDIAIMRYIGATSAFVVSPFIVEGIIIGLVSTIIACILQFILYNNVILGLINDYAALKINLIPIAEFFPLVPLTFLGIGLFAGIIASAISVKKHLNV